MLRRIEKFLVLVFILFIAVPVPAATVDFSILHTNDFHGQLEYLGGSNPGAARLAQDIEEVRAEVGAENVLLVDAGDMMQGSLLSNIWRGESTIGTFNAMGYDVATIGNHEFDWGQTVLSDRASQATFPFVAANIVVNDTGNCATAGWSIPSFVQPYVIIMSTIQMGFMDHLEGRRMTRQAKRAAMGAWALVLSVAAATGATAEEPKKPADAPKVTAGPEGFVLQPASDDYRLQLRGYVQFDGRFFPSDEGRLAVDNFLLRRVRPVFAGTLARHFEFQIVPDFGMGTTVLQDAWLDDNYSPKARVRAGKFRAPVGLERLQSATAITFVERAYPTALVPNRDACAELRPAGN